MDINVIKDAKDYKKAMERLDTLLEIVMEKGEDNVSQDILDGIKVLGLLISDYEDIVYPIKTPNPISAIKFAMEQNHLRPVDMAEYFGSPSRYYDILNGKRNLSLEMIKKLHKGLRIPYECLIPA